MSIKYRLYWTHTRVNDEWESILTSMDGPQTLPKIDEYLHSATSMDNHPSLHYAMRMQNWRVTLKESDDENVSKCQRCGKAACAHMALAGRF